MQKSSMQLAEEFQELYVMSKASIGIIACLWFIAVSTPSGTFPAAMIVQHGAAFWLIKLCIIFIGVSRLAIEFLIRREVAAITIANFLKTPNQL